MSFRPFYPNTLMRLPFSEEASQTFVKGNLVFVNTSGYLVECGADAALIMGVAAEDAHNGTQGQYDCAVDVILPGSVLIAKSNTTTDQTHVGAPYGIVLASSVWSVDISEDTTHTRCNILGLLPQDAVGTDGGRYILTFEPPHLQSSL